MSTRSQGYQAMSGLRSVMIAQSGKLWSFAVMLSNGQLCLYSPLAKPGPGLVESLAVAGPVAFLLAPNHYHNKGLAGAVANFPNARLVCSPAAEPRLAKITGFAFEGLDALSKALPAQIKVLHPPGLKSGEVWLQIEDGDERIWMVTDTFSSMKPNAKAGAARPALLGTFPRYGIADPILYSTWVKQQLDRRPPTMLLCCHGPPVKNADLAPSLTALLEGFP